MIFSSFYFNFEAMRNAATALIQLIRWPNLLILLLTQLIVWYCLIAPLNPRFLNFLHFLLLSLSVILIAAGGYIINDIYDVEIDLINKPQKVIVGIKIARSKALLIYYLFNLAAVFISIYLSFLSNDFSLCLFQLFCVLLLWLYARSLKKSYLLGNLAVALLTALTILILPFYEPVFREINFHSANQFSKTTPLFLHLYFIAGYTYFAFMTTWAREIIKDIQDTEGDKKNNAHTLPILSGKAASVRWFRIISLFIVAPLLFFSIAFFHGNLLLISAYLLFALILPLSLLLLQVSSKKPVAYFGRISTYLKFIMLLGLLALPLYQLVG